jgi:hypothetical protein
LEIDETLFLIVALGEAIADVIIRRKIIEEFIVIDTINRIVWKEY